MNENPLHEPPRGARFMGALRWGLLAVLAVVAIVSVASYLISRRTATTATANTEALYHCPMHPSYTSDRPGECPICGMDFEPISMSGVSLGSAGDVPGLTTVHIEPERLQLIGVRTAQAEKRSLDSALQLVGFVAPDEARIRRVQLRVSGWIQQLHVNRTGDTVAEDQPLLSIYSPQLFQSEQEFLIELGASEELTSPASGTHAHPGALDAARNRLRLLGVPAQEIERLERERKASTHLIIRSPVFGTVLERGAVEGQFVSADTPLFTIADLSQLWVLADLYEIDFTKLKVGDRASFEADGLPGRSFDGQVEFIYPTVSSQTRTLKVRLTMPNRNGELKPGMYGRVRVRGSGAPALTVPLEAVVHTGEQRYVFIVREQGHFEPRLVRTGRQDREHIEILGGLEAGDTVVASATFLIDSESRLRAAIQGMASPAGGAHDHGGQP